MSANFVAIPVLLVLLVVGLGMPVAIGVYVYRDAKRRGMDATLWTLIAVLAPTLIGFVVYLIARSKYPLYVCPKCGMPVEGGFTVCSQCGERLADACQTCGKPVRPEWKVCPQCGAMLPENRTGATPARRSDRGLLIVVLCIVLVPLLLIILGLVAFSVPGGAFITSETIESIQTSAALLNVF